MAQFPGLYFKDYNQDNILEYLKSGKGNLSDYRRLYHPNYSENSIYAWMGCQNAEFRIKCRMYRNPAKKPSQIEKFHEDFVRLKLVQNQKKWRQNMEAIVILDLPQGEMNEIINGII
jgi:hypothetical protein